LPELSFGGILSAPNYQLSPNMPQIKRKKLRIAQFITSQRSLPTPKGAIWAPIDLGLEIADAMAERGHKTTFYAPPSPTIKHKVISGKLKGGIFDKETYLEMKPELKKMPFGIPHIALFDAYLLNLMFADAAKGKYDVLHLHHERALPMVNDSRTPAIITLHDPINPYAARAYSLFRGPNARLISISMSQRAPAPNLPYAANIYNGVDTEVFKFGKAKRENFMTSGRLVPQKGLEDAIYAAKQCRVGLDIYGRYYSKYYYKTLAKTFTKKVRHRGNLVRSRLPAAYGRAKAMLFPIKWEEPFGLVMIEAMSCGTPVIAYDRGSVREVIKDGVTGYIVKNKRQMISAMKKIDRIDRHVCREWVQKRFSLERMVDDYEKLYHRVAK